MFEPHCRVVLSLSLMCLEWLVILGHWGPGTRSDTCSSCHSSREGSSLASPAHDSAVHCSGRGPLTGSAYQRTAHVAGNSPPAFATRFPQSVLGNQRVKYPNYAPLTVWHRFVDPRSFPWRFPPALPFLFSSVLQVLMEGGGGAEGVVLWAGPGLKLTY